MKPPFFKFFAFDFTADGFQRSLRPDEAGVYIRLLAQQWIDGGLRDDSRILRTLSGCDAVPTRAWRRIESRMREVFVRGDDGLLRHPKLDELQGQVAGVSPPAPSPTATRSDRSARMRELAMRRWGRTHDADVRDAHANSDAQRYATDDARCDAALARDADADAKKSIPRGIAELDTPCVYDAGACGSGAAPQCEPACVGDAMRNARPNAMRDVPLASPHRSALIADVVRHLHPQSGGPMLVYRAGRAGSTLAGGNELLYAIAETAVDLAQELGAAPKAISERCCDAYDAIRAAQAPQFRSNYGWHVGGWVKYRGDIVAIVAGRDLVPPPWKPGQSPPTRRRRDPGVAPVADWSDINSGRVKQGLVP